MMKPRIVIYEPFDETWGIIKAWRRNPLDGSEPVVTIPPQRWMVADWEQWQPVIIELANELPHPLLTFAVTVETNAISGIPAGATAIVGGQKLPGPIDDGELSIEVDHPQTFRVVLQHPLYAMWEGEVTCAPV